MAVGDWGGENDTRPTTDAQMTAGKGMAATAEKDGDTLYTAPEVAPRSQKHVAKAPPPPPTTTCRYPGGQCYELHLQQCSGSDEWTLHGLWPQWTSGCSGKQFDIDQLSSIRDDMDRYWLSCPGNGDTNEKFWAHEWSKHGTCSGMEALNYFQTGLHLREEYANECKGQTGNCAICFDKSLNSLEKCVGSQSSAALSHPLKLLTSAAEQNCRYPGGQCYSLSFNKCRGSDTWTLHGLWPEWSQGCGGPDFDAGQISSIRSQMDGDWLTCPEYHSTNEIFWAHEWSKHGSCSSMSEIDYFQAGLQLYKQYVSKCDGIDGPSCTVCFTKDLSQVETCSNVEATLVV